MAEVIDITNKIPYQGCSVEECLVRDERCYEREYVKKCKMREGYNDSGIIEQSIAHEFEKELK